MRSRRAATVTWLEPWPRARSNGPLRRAQRASAAERSARPTALAPSRAPRWWPMTSQSTPRRSASSTVWAKSRAVTRTSAPRARSTAMTGRSTRTWGLLVRSTQMRIAHRGDDLVDLVARERRRDGQREMGAGQLVGERQLDALGVRCHRLLAVDRRAVVAAGTDARRVEGLLEVGGAIVADHVEMPGGARAVGRDRQRRQLAEPGLRVPLADVAAVRRPALELGQLHAQDRGLQLVEARVVAHVLVGDLVPRAVEAQHAHAVGDLRVAGGDRAAVAERAEVLRRVEGERRDRAQRARAAIGA